MSHFQTLKSSSLIGHTIIAASASLRNGFHWSVVLAELFQNTCNVGAV